ncbi:MAG: choice-of-anchor D domain-containing protein [Smithella sp.]
MKSKKQKLLNSVVVVGDEENLKNTLKKDVQNSLYSKVLHVLLFCFLTFTFPLTAFSTTYYIDYNAANDSANGTSRSTPWKRCPGMVGFAGSYTHTAGDKFIFKGGVTWPAAALPFKISYSGTDGNQDQYTGGQLESTPWGAGYPVFDGEDIGKFSSGLIVNTGVKQYFIINGIKIIRAGDLTDGSGQAILLGGGSGITISNCWLEPNGVNAFAYSPYSGTHSAIYFHDNTIKNAGRVNISGNNARITDIQYYNNTHYGPTTYNQYGYHADGLMIGGDGTTDYAIKDLYIYNNKWIGDWSVGATAALYLNGTPMHCYDYTNGSHEPTAGQVAIGATSGYQSKIYTVTNTGGWSGSGTGTICQSSGNLLKGENLYETSSYGGNFIGKISSTGTSTSLKGTQNVYIYNNLIATDNVGGKAFSPGAIYISAGHDTLKIYNNTIDTRSNVVTPMSHCVYLSDFVSNIDIQNNILAGCDNGVTIDNNITGTVNIDYNLFYTLGADHLIWDNRISTRYNTCATVQAAGFGTNYCAIYDPLFIALPTGGVVGLGDWHLQPGSPARTNGTNLGAPYMTDMDGVAGTSRIGAYEYSDTGIRISTQTPDISFSPSLVSFSGVLSGTLSSPQTINVSNTGTEFVTISSISLLGTNANQFSIPAATDYCTGETVAASGNCSFQVIFSPTSEGEKTANVNITALYYNGSATLPLYGSAVVYKPTPRTKISKNK